jgi:predicted transcriptional regulator of viral defense system
MEQTDFLLNRFARLNGGVVRTGSTRSALDRALAEWCHPLEPSTISKALAAMVSRGDAIRLANGVFAVCGPRGELNPVAIAPRLAEGAAYVSMWTVIDRAGLTYNTPRLVSVVTDRQVRTPVVEVPAMEAAFYFHTISPSRFFGFTEQPTDDGLSAPIARTEKALLDILWFVDTPDAPPAFEQVGMWAAAAAAPSFNPRLLIDYVARMDSPSLVRRAGYLMDRSGIDGADELWSLRGRTNASIPLFGKNEAAGDLGRNRWGVV